MASMAGEISERAKLLGGPPVSSGAAGLDGGAGLAPGLPGLAIPTPASEATLINRRSAPIGAHTTASTRGRFMETH